MTASPALPTFEEWRASASSQVVDFISDLHLGDDTPRGFDTWALYMRSTPADVVVILGDLFEVWVGDDARESGFGARCAEVLRAAAAVRQVAFMAGNRDFLVGRAMLVACGVRALSDPTILVLGADRVLLSHGDLLCLDDTDYQRFRSMVRSPAWQRDFLALPLAERRRRAQQMREQSRLHQKTRPNAGISDLDLPTTAQWMRAAATPTFVHGHTHRPATQVLAPGLVRHVLSDWDLDHATDKRAEVLRWQRNTWKRVPLQP